jgi:hypothetical protein
MDRTTCQRLRGLAAALLLLAVGTAGAQDVSRPAILQWFEASYDTLDRRTPDLFMAGYGAVWLPPPGRAGESGGGTFSAGYDVYDRFDLGSPGNPTMYGTEDGLRKVAAGFHRAGVDLHLDFIINHNGYNNSASKDGAGDAFVAAGDYPGFVVTLPNDVDGDFHSAFDRGDLNGRINDGLLDIDHAKNHRFIRNPVPGFKNNLPAGTKKAYGRLADVPEKNNRRFYPDRTLSPILLFDPRTGEHGIQVFPFNRKDPLKGSPVEENATGYLMRNAQWLVQDVGADGFRIDAAKHVEGFVLDLFDRAVYRASPRPFLDGSPRHVFSYCEANFADRGTLRTYVKKTVRPDDPGRIGGNRDTLDFALFFKLRDHLGSGLGNDWREIHEASLDSFDDGLQNGSAGVKFVASHDDFGPHLSNVGHAYALLMPGHTVVYHNAKEFGDNRAFPKAGRGDALGGLFGDRITRLVQLRNTHGRGSYRLRLLEKELLGFEREGSLVVLLSNRLDGGFDSRTVKVSFPPGTPLVELTGNASDPAVDPTDDVPELVVVNPDRTINVRIPRNATADGKFHGRGYLAYGLATPQSADGIELTNVDHVRPGEKATAGTNGTARLTPVHVIKADTFQVRIKTREVKLLGSVRDPSADGDNALLRIDDGTDVNGDGKVDFTAPGTVSYGFETFKDKRSPRVGPGGGDGAFVQTVDATKLGNGVHFLEVRVFRHRPGGGPPVYSSFKRVIAIERP